MCKPIAPRALKLEQQIAKIRDDVYDLSNPFELLLGSNGFVELSCNLSTEDVRFLIELLRTGALTNETDADIAVLILAYSLKEDDYCREMSVLLESGVSPGICNMVLMPPFCFGAGYVNVYLEKPYRGLLQNMLGKSHLAPDLRSTLDFIATGEGHKSYVSFLEDPELLGYPAEISKSRPRMEIPPEGKRIWGHTSQRR